MWRKPGNPIKTFGFHTRAQLNAAANPRQQASIETVVAAGPWKPKEAKGSLPDVSNIAPREIQLQSHPRFRKGPQSLLRAIDLENRFRYDADRSRTNMFFGSDAAAKPGCILLVDMISSRVNPQPKHFAGVLLGIREKGLLQRLTTGIMSNIVLRTVVMGVGVEQTIPVFSPMVSSFTILRPAPSSLSSKSAVYWIRNKYTDTKGIDFGEIEGMVMKHKNQLFRAKQIASETASKVKGVTGREAPASKK
ncbi:hypothetical protein HDV03_001644 [Kappamyces sp. JEL0829]|nr:hypothetical protein HDV03_001644 [Kappamyces sp. JEL0829]